MSRLIKQHGRLARRLLADRANPAPIIMLFWQLPIKKGGEKKPLVPTVCISISLLPSLVVVKWIKV